MLGYGVGTGHVGQPGGRERRGTQDKGHEEEERDEQGDQIVDQDPVGGQARNAEARCQDGKGSVDGYALAPTQLVSASSPVTGAYGDADPGEGRDRERQQTKNDRGVNDRCRGQSVRARRSQAKLRQMATLQDGIKLE